MRYQLILSLRAYPDDNLYLTRLSSKEITITIADDVYVRYDLSGTNILMIQFCYKKFKRLLCESQYERYNFGISFRISHFWSENQIVSNYNARNAKLLQLLGVVEVKFAL